MPESADRTKIQSEEIASLRSQLRDAKEILHAIRTGKADALVVARNGKDVVYTLENADKPFRLFIEEMQEGAVTVDEHGLILYANRRFASFVETSLSSVIGSAFYDYVCAADRVIVSNFLHNKTGQGEKIEVSLCANHRLLPVFLAASPFLLDDAECEKLLCIVITDLSPQREVEAAASLDREWKNRYEAVIRASGHLLYDWNPQTNEIIFGGDTERTLGYTAAEMSGSLEKWSTRSRSTSSGSRSLFVHCASPKMP